MLKNKQPNFLILEDGVLRYKSGRICVPNDSEIKKQIMCKAHNTTYTMHPGTTKMYKNLKSHFWWPSIKKDVVDYVARCLICQQVKIEHKKLGNLLQPLKIPEWKKEEVTIDFVSSLPRSQWISFLYGQLIQ